MSTHHNHFPTASNDLHASSDAPCTPKYDPSTSRHNVAGRLEEDSPPRRPQPDLFPTYLTVPTSLPPIPHRPQQVSLPPSDLFLQPASAPTPLLDPASLPAMFPFEQPTPALGLDFGFPIDQPQSCSQSEYEIFPTIGANEYDIIADNLNPGLFSLNNLFSKAFYAQNNWAIPPELTVNPALTYTPPPTFLMPELMVDDEDNFSVYSDGPETPWKPSTLLPAVEITSMHSAPPTRSKVTHAQPLPFTPATPGPVSVPTLLVVPPSPSPMPVQKRKRQEPTPIAEVKPRVGRPRKSLPIVPDHDEEDEGEDGAYEAADEEVDDEEYDDEPAVKRRRASGSAGPRRPGRRTGGKPRPEPKHKCQHAGCDKMYARPYDRDRHMANEHEPDPELREQRTCHKCGKYFSRPDALKRHTTSTARCKQLDDD